MSGEAAACPMEPNASFARGIKFAQDAVQEIREKLVEFEKLHPELPEKACSFLAENLDKSRDGIQALLHLTEVMKCGAAEIPIRAIIGAVSQAGTALSGLQDKAGQFDEKIKPVFGVSALVVPAVEQAFVGLALVSATAADHAQKDLTHLQGLSHGLRNEVAAAAKGGALDKVVKPTPEKAANEAFKITDRVAVIRELAAKSTKELDGKFGPPPAAKGTAASSLSSTFAMGSAFACFGTCPK
eukprot:RCo029492